MKTSALVSVSLGVAVVVAGLTYLVTKYELCTQAGPTGDPPVKIVGGSMTFRSHKTWHSSGSGFYTDVSTSVPKVIQLEHVQLSPGTAFVDKIVPITAKNWKIEVDARHNAGYPASGNGVNVCGDANCNLNNPSTTSVFIFPFTASAAVGFYGDPSTGNNPNPESPRDTNPYYGKRYMDQTSRPCTWGGFCEHIYQIIITLSSSAPTAYLCPDGECRVYIGQ